MKQVLFYLCLFPYVGFGILTTDTQPWSLLFSLFIILIISFNKKIKFPRAFVFILISCFVAIGYLMFGLIFIKGDVIYGITSLSYYVTIPIIILAVYNVGIPDKIGKIFLVVYMVWLVFGILQLFIPSVSDLFVNSVRTSGERGVTSLAPEPVWYARSVLIMTLIAICLYWEEKLSKKVLKSIVLLSVFQVVVLGLSGTGFFYLCLFIFLYVLFVIESKRYKLIFFSAIISISIFLISLGISHFGDKRVFNLIQIALESPEDLAKFGGFNMRVLNAPLALKVGLFETSGIGAGLITVPGQFYEFSFFGESIHKEDVGKLNGGLVLFIYQIGVFGIFWLYGFSKLIFRNQNVNIHRRQFIFFAVFFILFFESSPVNPIVAYLIAIILLSENKRKILYEN